MSVPDAATLQSLALDVAARGAALARRHTEQGVAVADTKSSSVDIVTAADREVEQLVRGLLEEARPDDVIVGEEQDDHAPTAGASSGVRWVVDPIDGTVNYLYGIPQCAVSLAAQVDGVTVAGVVHNIVTDEVWTATTGGGAWCRRPGAPPRRLAVRPPAPLAQRLVLTGFGYERAMRADQGAAVARLLPQVRDVRRLGAASLDLCAVAAGWADGYLEEGLNEWDDAAGALVATEAGARVEVFTGPHGRRFVACAPAHGFDELLALAVDCGLLASDDVSTGESPGQTP